MSKTTTAFWITNQQCGELRTVVLAPPAENEVRVRTVYSGISLGTEALIYNQAVPPSEYQRMRAPFQDGDFPFPVKYGYINVGIVEDGLAALNGRTVFCLYPHQTHYNVPCDAVTPLPEGVPAQRAVLTANLETAINAVWDAAPCVGDSISIVGGGVVGCLVAWLVGQLPGCDVELIDTNAERADICRRLGVRFSLPDTATGDRDLVVHASATQEGLTQALSLAGFEATVLELSWYGDKSVALPLGEAFHSQRLQLRSSQVGQIAVSQRSRWSFQRRLTLALSLLRDNTLDALISGESHFSQLPDTFRYLMRDGRTSLCHCIRYDG